MTPPSRHHLQWSRLNSQFPLVPPRCSGLGHGARWFGVMSDAADAKRDPARSDRVEVGLEYRSLEHAVAVEVEPHRVADQGERVRIDNPAGEPLLTHRSAR